jgi:hypothetical protein
MRNHRGYCTALHAAAADLGTADLAAGDVWRVLKTSTLFLLLDGAAVHRCDNWLVFSDDLAAEGSRSPQCDFYHRLPEVYPFIHSLGTCLPVPTASGCVQRGYAKRCVGTNFSIDLHRKTYYYQ